MSISKDGAATQRPAAGQAEKDVAPSSTGRKPLGPYLFSHQEIPKEIVAFVAERLGKDAEAHPARADGGYKGKVLLNGGQFLVQAVGRTSQSAVVHRKDGLELVGSNLNWRDKNQRLGSVDVQIHYSGDKAKAYSWDRQKEDQKRFVGRAQEFAKTITNEKERSQFLANFAKMVAGPQKGTEGKAKAPDKALQKDPPTKGRSAGDVER